MKKRILFVSLGVLLAVIVAAGSLMGYTAYAYSDRALPGTHVGGVDAGNMTAEELTTELRQRAAAAKINLKVDGLSEPVSLADTGMRVDVDKTVDAAFAPTKSFFWRSWAFLTGHDTAVEHTFNRETFDDLLTDVLSRIDHPVVEPEITWSSEDSAFTVVPGAPGKTVDRDEVAKALEDAVQNLSSQDLSLTAIDGTPRHSQEDAETAAQTANDIVALEVHVTDGIEEADAARDERAKWVTVSSAEEKLTPVINEEAVRAWVTEVGTGWEVAPIERVENVDSNGVTLATSRPGKTGWKLDNGTEIGDAVLAALKNGESYSGEFDYVEAEPPVRKQPIAPGAEALPYAAAEGEKWLDVNLTNATITAYVGTEVVHGPTPMVPGKPATPTVTGTYNIYMQLESQTMRGTNLDGSTYEAKGVPWISYFYEGYAIHGAPWYRTFGWSGNGGSHGCVSLPVDEAKWFYDWSEVGTIVNNHY